MDKSLVTIVMSTKNRQVLLRRAIRSVLEQTLKDWRLVIIDDNSTNGTWSYLERLMDTRIRITKNTDVRPGGFSWEKQKYMLEAESKYVCILDDDDYWEPTYLERCTNILETSRRHPMTYTDCYLINEEGEVRLEYTSKGFPFPDVLPSLCVFRTDIFKQLGAWDLDFFQHSGRIIHAEIDYYLKLLKLNMRPIHIPIPLVTIYRTTTSMGSSRELSAHGNLKIMERWEEYLKKDKKDWAAFNCRVGINLEEAYMRGSRKYFVEAIKTRWNMWIAWAALICSLLGHKVFVGLYKQYRRISGFDGKVIYKVRIDRNGLW